MIKLLTIVMLQLHSKPHRRWICPTICGTVLRMSNFWWHNTNVLRFEATWLRGESLIGEAFEVRQAVCRRSTICQLAEEWSGLLYVERKLFRYGLLQTCMGSLPRASKQTIWTKDSWGRIPLRITVSCFILEWRILDWQLFTYCITNDVKRYLTFSRNFNWTLHSS